MDEILKDIYTWSVYSEEKKLNFNERVDEIAKMLSGDILSDSALVHARELLN